MSIATLVKTDQSHLTKCMTDDYLDEAINKMVKANRNAMAAIDNTGQLRGILTDHDVIQAVHLCNQKSTSVNKEVVSSWMTSQVVTCDMDSTMTHALNLMGKNKIRHLVATENNRPVAVVSIRDILSKMHANDVLEINVLRDVARASRASYPA